MIYCSAHLKVCSYHTVAVRRNIRLISAKSLKLRTAHICCAPVNDAHFDCRLQQQLTEIRCIQKLAKYEGELFVSFLRATIGTAIARLSHRNSVRPSVCPSVRHTGVSVKNGAS